MDKRQFNLEYQYELYMKRIGLNERRMSPVQKTETKRAFMGACGQLLHLLLDDVGKLPEEQGFEIYQDLLLQVGNFWMKETNQVN